MGPDGTIDGGGGGSPPTRADSFGGRTAPPGTVEKHLAAAEAALMLVESLMLALVERGVLSADQVVDAVETVIEAKRQIVSDGSHPEIAVVAAGLVTTVANSIAAMGKATPAPDRGPRDTGPCTEP